MKKISLTQVARSTKLSISDLIGMAQKLGIPVVNETIEPRMEEHLVAVAELIKADVSLEEAIALVQPSIPQAPSGESPAQPEQAQYDAVSADEVAMVLQQKVGGVLGKIQEQGNALLAQVDQQVIDAANEFNAQLNDRVGLFWLAVATDEGGKLPGDQPPIVNLTPVFSTTITGRLDRKMLAPRSQNLLAG
ncbi:hypothetical protein ACQ4M3_29060 [Leptolyngbya sp. AN03gr2]|uniref:hypothetical protein n=1 Tax=unclassified Leptolyngbya TaxID=2650499 RepID=UPI003D31AE8F